MSLEVIDRTPSILASFADKVLIGDGCWEWVGGCAGRDGYGRMSVGGRMFLSHRVMYELLVGPIPEGLQLDHLCHSQDPTCPGGLCIHRRCVRPDHLEPVTARENQMRSGSVSGRNARATHCPSGHPYSPENTYINPASNGRCCRVCRKAHSRAHREREVAAKRVRSAAHAR